MSLLKDTRIVYFAISGGLFLTVLLFSLAYNKLASNEEVLFLEEYSQLKEQILLKARKGEEISGNISSIFRAADYVEPSEFQIVAEEQLARYPYIYSIAFLPRVLRPDVDAFEHDMQESGFVTYAIRSKAETASNSYFPVKYIEPLTPINASLLGMDLMSINDYSPHIKQAVNTGKIASGNVEVLKAGNKGFIAFKALYPGGGSNKSVVSGDRANAILAIKIDITKLMESIMPPENISLTLSLLDELHPSRSQGMLLFEESGREPNQQLLFQSLKTERTLGFGGISLSLTAEKYVYWRNIEYFYLSAAILMGLLLTMLLVFAARTIQLRDKELRERNVEIERQVEGKTHDLKNSESRFRSVVENASDWIWEVDANGVYTHCSSKVEVLLGYRHDEIIGKTPFDFMVPEDVERIGAEFVAIIAAKKQFRDLVNWNLSKDGRRVCLLTSGTPMLSDDGELLGYRGVDTNITERKKSELFIQNTSEVLEMIAEGRSARTIYDAIALMYEARHSGLRCSMLELKGNKLMHGGAPSLPKIYCDAVNGLEYGPSVGSCGTSTFTGKRVLVENIETDPKWDKIKHVAMPHGMRCCWSEPIINSKGVVLGAFGMYYNHPALPNAEELSDLESAGRLAGIVMEREHREITLRQSENKYRTLVENLPQRFYLKDNNSLFISCSKNLAEDLGIKPEQIVGTTDFDYFPQEIADRHQQNDQRVILDKVAEETEESIIVDGEERVIQTIKSPVLDEDGNIDGIIGVFWDITEQKLLKEQFHQSQKMESVGTLVGGVAHEFNNTLAGITGRLYLAKNSADNPEVIRHIDKISTLSFRAAEMIQQLLAFSRKSPVQMNTFDLSSFIKETYKLHRFSIPENINMVTKYSHDLLPVHGDTTQFQQILVNLLHNARDAVEGVSKPKISLSLELFEADSQFMQVHSKQTEKQFAHLMVEDNGCGISDKDKESIFDPFFTTKEVGKGTGLGLSMIYGAIQTHKGIIDVDSEVGKGTRMDIYIPLSLAETVDIQAQDLLVVQGNGESILLVDDEAELREIGKEVLESLGYSVLVASNGSEAIATYLSNESVRLILMDVVMPEMGGVEAALAIKSFDSDAKIIFCTGYDKEDVLNEIDKSHALAITKPYDINELSRTIREVLLH